MKQKVIGDNVKVFIYATEGLYQGLHGIYFQDVMDVDNRIEADDIAWEQARGLVESYGLEEEYDEFGTDYESEFCWEVHKIRNDVTLSWHELQLECSRLDRDSFIEQYCDEEEWFGVEGC